jgi:hypothetical protein
MHRQWRMATQPGPTGPLAPGVRASPGTVGYLGNESDLIELSPGDSLAGTSLAGNASWDGNTLRITASGFTMAGYLLNCGLYTTTLGLLTVDGCVIDRSGLADSVYGIYGVSCPVTVRDTTIRDSAPTGAGAACVKSDASQVQLYRCDLSGFEDGFQVTGADSIVDQVAVHRLDDLGVDPHNDCGQDFKNDGTGKTTVTNSYLECSGLGGGPALGQSAAWTVYGVGSICRNSYFADGAFFLRFGTGSATVVEDNNFGPVGPGQFGEVTLDGVTTFASWARNRNSSGVLIPQP